MTDEVAATVIGRAVNGRNGGWTNEKASENSERCGGGSEHLLGDRMRIIAELFRTRTKREVLWTLALSTVFTGRPQGGFLDRGGP